MRISVLSGARLSRALSGPVERCLVIGFAVLWTVVVAHVALTLSGVATASAVAIRVTDVLYVAAGSVAAVLIGLRARHVQAERAAWWCLAASMALFAFGNLLWDLLYLDAAEPPYPSWADAAWTLYYLPTYAGLALLVRARLRDLPRAFALDGLVSALGLAALVAGVVLGPILAETQGAPLTVVVNVVYPVGDLVLLALCVATLALMRGRPDSAWLVLIAGLAANAAADTTYLFQSAVGSYVDGGPLDVLWVLGMASVALAAWQNPRDGADHAPGARDHVIPALFSVAAIGVLGYGALESPLPLAAVALAVATILATGVRIALVVRDVQNLSESRRLAESDDLTGLLNRRGLALRLEAALRTVRDDGSPLSLLLLDLNDFKEVNDTLGHHAGDQLLQQVATRLEASLPGIALARLGGDEFVALIACGPAAALAEAGRLRLALSRPVELDGLTTHTQASIGIASSPQHGARSGDLLRHADVAMYRAKHRRTGVELYAPDGDANSRERLALVTELRGALRDPHQIHLVYQPQVDLDTGRVSGVEALVRWQHPRHGLLMPDRFLELVEQHSLMHDLTLAVLERALRQQRAWRRAGIELVVAVNVSAADLLDGGFPAHVARELAAHGTPAGALQLELTEKTVMREPGRALDTLARLSELGVTLSLDDFGTGYSSLAHLKRLPVQELKVDRSFVMDMLSDRDDAIIVRSTVELGRSLGLRVVAEGVETVEQLERLRYFGCHLVQGYLFSRPLPAVDIPGWLAGHRPAAVTARPAGDGADRGHQSEADILTALLSVAGRIVEGAPLGAVFAELGRQLREVVPHDDLVVYRLEPSDFTLAALHAEGPFAHEAIRERFPAREGITGAALREGRTRNVARTDLDPDSVPVVGVEKEPEALVCCPMRCESRPLGVLNVYRASSALPFSSAEAATIERFAAVASLALRRGGPAPDAGVKAAPVGLARGSG